MDPAAERRAEIDERQAFVAGLLADAGAELLLLLEPANVAWFCGAPLGTGILDPAEQPALVVGEQLRWLIAGNVDSRRLFDTYLDGLGFQLKEWPWYQPREQLLAEACNGRSVACDRPLRNAADVADRLRAARRKLSHLAQESLRKLGRDLAHAIEATARNFERGASEMEVAGQVGHRLLHHAVEPVVVHVAADGRFADDPRPIATARAIESGCVIAATASCDGLYASASRVAWFRPIAPALRKDYDAACSLVAARAAALQPGAMASALFTAGQRAASPLGVENAWRDYPVGHWSGRLPVEQPLWPNSSQVAQTGHAMVLQARVGSALACETYLIGEEAAELATPATDWPVRQAVVGEQRIPLPDILPR
jgi:Xaa-Pro aminopeptidase